MATEQPGDIRRLYAFHLLNGVAISVVGSYVFIDRLLLRYGLEMSQFGTVKALARLGPVLVFFLSVYLVKLRADAKVVATVYLFRVATPLLLLVLPTVTQDRGALTIGFGAILLLTTFFPSVGQTCLQTVFREHIPQRELGRRIGSITTWWSMVSYMAAIPCAWFLDRHSGGSNAEFLRAYMTVAVATAVLQLPASWVMWRLATRDAHAHVAESARFRDILGPFQDAAFRRFLSVSLVLTVLFSMVAEFLNPYLFTVHGLGTRHVSVIEAIVMAAGLLLVPYWGHVADRMGGRNVLQVCVFGTAVGLACLAGGGMVFLVLFGVLAWKGRWGVMGFGMVISRQLLTISLAEESRTTIYVAAATLIAGVGQCIGSFVGGVTLDWLDARTDAAGAHYATYFLGCAVALAVVGLVAGTVRDGRRKLSPWVMGMLIWRSLRSRLNRG